MRNHSPTLPSHLRRVSRKADKKLAPFGHSEEHRYFRFHELNQIKVQGKIDGRHTPVLLNVVSLMRNADRKCKPSPPGTGL